MRLTARQLKGLIKEAVATSLNEAKVSDAIALADEARASLNALKKALEVVAINRGGDGESDADSWEKASKLVARLAGELDRMDVLSPRRTLGRDDF